jgi:hypothetical protein
MSAEKVPTMVEWKSMDGTRSHWKYVVENVIVHRDVHRERLTGNN